MQNAAQVNLPPGWTMEEVPPFGTVLRHPDPQGGFVTVDMKRRGYTGGMVQVSPYNQCNSNEYKGRNWQQRIIDDAISWLRGIYPESADQSAPEDIKGTTDTLAAKYAAVLKSMSVTPTTEQIAILEKTAELTYDQLMQIYAFAGAAKTSTLIMIALAFPQYKFLYLAFNKAITEEGKKRFPSNVVVKTTHSLAYQYTAAGRNVRKGGYRAAEIADIFSVDYQTASFVWSVFDFFCNSALTEFSQISADAHVLSLAEKLYSMMQRDELEITHSFYLKEFQLFLMSGRTIRQTFDFALLDEAQDTNPVTLSIFKHLSGRKIMVGDRHQSIYSFRGAINALADTKSKTEGLVRMRLTTTFRCLPHIVDRANWVLQTFKNERMKIVSGNTSEKKADTQAFITRTNSALIEFVDSLDNFNLTRPPELIFDCLMSLMHWKYGMLSSLSKQYKFLSKFRHSAEILNYIEETSDQELKQGMKLLDKYDNGTEGFRDGKKILELYEKARKNYNQNGASTTTLTTAHSAKGLEFDMVTLGTDYPDMAAVIAKLCQNRIVVEPEDFYKSSKHEVITAREEANLYYVAITRARYVLRDDSPMSAMYATRMTFAEIMTLPGKEKAGGMGK